MSRRNVQNKHPDSAEHRAEPRAVSPDEFKHELLKFARRDAKPLAIIDLAVSNVAAITTAVGGDALPKLSRSLHAAAARCGETAHVHTAIGPTRLLILVLDNADAVAENLRKRLSRLSLPNAPIRPTVQLRVEHVAGRDAEAALRQLGIDIDEHGRLCELKSELSLSGFGSKARWMERFEVDGDVVRDRWRGAVCVQSHLRIAQAKVSPALFLKRLKALQSCDHPGLQPLLDFWLDEKECVLMAAESHGTPFAQWLSKHKLDGELAKELALQYASILIYGRSLTPVLDLHGLREHLAVLSAELRLQLIAPTHATIAQLGENGAPEAEAVRDAREFAESLGLRVSGDASTLTKLRAALKNAQLQ